MIFRWLALAAVIGTLGISVYYRHRARRTGNVVARRREGFGLMLARAGGALVTTGPYRWMRHPLYAMGGALFFAVGLMSASWFILGVACLGVALIRLVVVPMEEQALVAKFGDEYRAYMNRTGGLVPSVSVWRHSSNEARRGAQRR